jgi:hypothetical protein
VTRLLWLVVMCAAAATTGIARAQSTSISHPFGVSLRVGAPIAPLGHVGIPIADGYHLSPELGVRWQLDEASAVLGGFGLPHAGAGLGLWVAYEAFVRVAAARDGLVALELFVAPGLGVGFAGPDWLARSANVYVGYDYVVSGTALFDARLASGARLSWANGSLDTSIEALPIVTFTPAVEVLFSLVLDVRARF